MHKLLDRMPRCAFWRALICVGSLSIAHPYCLGQIQHQTNDVSPVVQRGGLPYYLSLRVVDHDLAALPTLHSFVQAQHDGKWLLLSGRTNGLHSLIHGGMNAFPTSSRNRELWVYDPLTKQSWHRSLDDPSLGLTRFQADSLATTNAQYYQTDDQLYITGGYGFVDGQGFRTFDTLTAIDLAETMSWVQSGQLEGTTPIRQLRDELFQVTGGAMYRMEDRTLLVFGQNFDGPYQPLRTGVYTQQVRSFHLLDDGTTLSIQDEARTVPNADYRRRDLNVAPVLRPSQDGGTQTELVAFSGVFTTTDGAWTVPVEIDGSGQPTMADPALPQTFKQAMNGYHSAKLAMYSATTQATHNVLFGGLSLQYLDREAGTLVTDNLLPFINQVTSIVSNDRGEYVQHLLSSEFPRVVDPVSGKELRFGANAEFMRWPSVPVADNDVIWLDALTQATSLGLIYGGLVSDAPNFGKTAASDLTFEVVLTPRVAGDFNRNGPLDASDVDQLSQAIRESVPDPQFDLNLDGNLDDEDRRIWVEELTNTYFGDANLDGEFGSTDLVQVFQAGEYEDSIAANSGWASGDWNGDGEFATGDLVTAFQSGGYEQGPVGEALGAVPEPTSLGPAAALGLVLLNAHRRCVSVNRDGRRG